MKSRVRDGEVVGLQADPSEPAPLEVRVVRPLPVEALTLNRVPCPVSPSLTAWRTARGFAQGCRGRVVSRPVCGGRGGKPAPPPHPFNRASYSHWEREFRQAVPLGSPPPRHRAGRILGEAGRGCCNVATRRGFSSQVPTDAARGAGKIWQAPGSPSASSRLLCGEGMPVPLALWCPGESFGFHFFCLAHLSWRCPC